MDSVCSRLRTPAWATTRFTSFVTGAGESLASGIPTFGERPQRDLGERHHEARQNAYLERDPAGSWSWYLSRFARLQGAQPNPAHVAIAGIERWQHARGGAFLLVTQNVDGLHRAAGSGELVEVHGRADRLRCSREGCALGAPAGSLPRADVDVTAFLASPSRATVPRCPACGALCANTSWFDEVYTMHADYEFERAMKAARRADLVVFAGTSFAVGITDSFSRRRAVARWSTRRPDPSRSPLVSSACCRPGGDSPSGVTRHSRR